MVSSSEGAVVRGGYNLIISLQVSVKRPVMFGFRKKGTACDFVKAAIFNGILVVEDSGAPLADTGRPWLV